MDRENKQQKNQKSSTVEHMSSATNGYLHLLLDCKVVECNRMKDVRYPSLLIFWSVCNWRSSSAPPLSNVVMTAVAHDGAQDCQHPPQSPWQNRLPCVSFFFCPGLCCQLPSRPERGGLQRLLHRQRKFLGEVCIHQRTSVSQHGESNFGPSCTGHCRNQTKI